VGLEELESKKIKRKTIPLIFVPPQRDEHNRIKLRVAATRHVVVEIKKVTISAAKQSGQAYGLITPHTTR
jgi:hypothetical protein